MANSYITFIDTILGRINQSWRGGAKDQLENIRSQQYNLLTAVTVAAGTSTSDFDLQWSPYPVPESAIVIEQTVPPTFWATYNGGANWYDMNNSLGTSTGTLLFGLLTLQTGYLWLDGSAYDIASYSGLNTHLTNIIPTAADRRRSNRVYMSTYTSGSNATFTFRRTKNGISNGDTVNLYWGGFSRLSMTVSSVSTTSFVLSGGAGDSLTNTVSTRPGTNYYWDFAATKFTLPDARDTIFYGASDMDGSGSSTSILSSTRSGLLTFTTQGVALSNYDSDEGDMFFPVGVQIKT